MVDPLFRKIAENVQEWKNNNFYHKDYPAISEILKFSTLEDGSPRYLRSAQIMALETYWYLRLVENTPHIINLYNKYYPDEIEFLEILGIPTKSKRIQKLMLKGKKGLLNTLKSDQKLVKELKLESLYETLTLNYPSYILALAMGAGKTILIGSIIATEFALALEYPKGPFIRNALVFAPGKTIIESLKQLSDIPFDKILPPRLYKPFSSNLKMTFTRDGEKEIPVQRNSHFNLIVTNTEKIRIQKPTSRRKSYLQLKLKEKEEEEEAIANRRLQTIASLPNLGIFSDEAHHTYGEEMERELKKVRQTVDYLHQNTNLICVVNTTGTPYYKRQPLKDVVVWYGLSQGIKDNILKEVSGNIFSYDFSDDKTKDFVREVIEDFFRDYKDHTLPDGTPAKIALYFPQEEDLVKIRPTVETTLAKLGLSPAIVLKNTSKSTQDEIDAFNRLNHRDSLHRVILLVNKGTEGWDCPSLFSCALIRKLKTSNNFVLQAATRCLRQVPGNNKKARIYLSEDNRAILEKQLNETYGETLAQLNNSFKDYSTVKIYVRKVNLFPLVIKKEIQRVVSKPKPEGFSLKFSLPKSLTKEELTKKILQIEETTKKTILIEKERDVLTTMQEFIDLYSASVELSAIYRLPADIILEALREIYPQKELPKYHLLDLASQIEKQLFDYEIKKEYVTQTLALIRPEGFNKEGDKYVTEIRFLTESKKGDLLTKFEEVTKLDRKDLSFHYTPYDFDSQPEKDFFLQILSFINEKPESIEGFYFTGALSDPEKTDFYVEYKKEDGSWHRYSPDFLIRRKDGKCYIVEIKSEREKDDKIDGEKGAKALAVQELVKYNQDKIKYEMVFVRDSVPENKLYKVKEFIKETR